MFKVNTKTSLGFLIKDKDSNNVQYFIFSEERREKKKLLKMLHANLTRAHTQ